MSKLRIIKMTVHEPAYLPMGHNSLGAATYGEWCELEAVRMGKDAYVMYETRKMKVDGKEVFIEFCHVEKRTSKPKPKYD